MSSELFLIDANSLITPHLNYYPFDFASSFWEQMESQISGGRIIILDMVKHEVLRGNDRLQEWMKRIEIGRFIDHREPQILQEYGEILDYIQSEPCYKPAALAEWARESTADPWLIASAKVNNCTIVTFETRNKGLNEKNPSKRAKIPDVADVFGVKTSNLFDMMRVLGFKL